MTRKFYRTVYTIEVLSEDTPATGLDPDQLHYEIYEGHCSGVVSDDGGIEIDGPTAARLLIAQGSDPEFFRLDEDGNELEDDTMLNNVFNVKGNA